MTAAPDLALAMPAERKQFSNLRARAALRGYELLLVDDGEPRFIVQRWNLRRDLADLAEIERFLEAVGA